MLGEVLLSLALVSCIRGIDEIFFEVRLGLGVHRFWKYIYPATNLTSVFSAAPPLPHSPKTMLGVSALTCQGRRGKEQKCNCKPSQKVPPTLFMGEGWGAGERHKKTEVKFVAGLADHICVL